MSTVGERSASSATSTSTALLEAIDYSTGYGRIPVVRNLDLHVEPGEVVVILGANGAGKSTTLLGLCGELPAMSGEVRWMGQPATTPLHVRARQGLAYVPEERSVTFSLSTRENLRLGRGTVDGALELAPELGPLLDRRAGLLSGGEQQIVVLARALAAEPKLLIADELSLGLAPLIVERLLNGVRAAADRGVGVLLVEQHVGSALAVADRAYVIRRGHIVLEGAATDLSGRMSEIQAMYLAADEE